MEYLDKDDIEYMREREIEDFYRSPSGYGRKIRTAYMLRLKSTGRLHRIYAICFSNCASYYLRYRGRDVFVQDWVLDDAKQNKLRKYPSQE